MSAPADVRAAVSDGDGSVTLESLNLAGVRGWLRVETSGLCGTDIQLHHGGLAAPAVLGHHVVGHVEHLDEALASATGVAMGDRVVLEEYLGCGECTDCRAGAYRFCPQAELWTGGQRVGMVPVTVGSGLHGGNAQYLELTHRHVMHKLPVTLSADLAAWTLPFANAIEWVTLVGGVRQGSRVAIIGPGYHGIACAAAARHAGAAEIHLFGLESDHVRLDMASGLGVETHVDRDHVRDIDVVIDTIGNASTVALGSQLLGRFGMLVLAGIAAGEQLTFEATALVRELLTIRGVRGRSPEAVQRSIAVLSSQETGLEAIPAVRVGLDEVGATLANLKAGIKPATPHIIVDPWQVPIASSPSSRLQEVAP